MTGNLHNIFLTIQKLNTKYNIQNTKTKTGKLPSTRLPLHLLKMHDRVFVQRNSTGWEKCWTGGMMEKTWTVYNVEDHDKCHRTKMSEILEAVGKKQLHSGPSLISPSKGS